MQTAELVALPLADRLQAMEALWDSLCREESVEVVMPTWHGDELAKRLALIDSGQDLLTPWEAAKLRIRDKAGRSASSA
jgi:putative addiction module component (TIGR02574 family)